MMNTQVVVYVHCDDAIIVVLSKLRHSTSLVCFAADEHDSENIVTVSVEQHFNASSTP